MNFVQLRPDHIIDYYLFVGYNLFEDTYGKVYTFLIPSNDIHELIINYGSYSHGTVFKLGNITKDNILEIMLIQIPSVSITTAKPIAEKYKTLKNLIDELDKDKTCLNNITYKCKNGKYRKISKTSIDNIYRYLVDNI